MLVRATLAALAAVLAAAGPAGASDTAAVRITDRLEPPVVTVASGDTVTWRNADAERHRIRSTSGPERFDSGNLEPSETWSHTFSVPGEYRYADAREDEDQAYWGTVTVTGDTGAGDAPSGDSASARGAAPGAGDGAAVSMGDRSFSPASLTVPAGTSVTWVNDSDRDHTVTADDGSFDSGELAPGARFTQAFEREGTYDYFCAFHGGMRGTVVVGEASAGDDTPDADPTGTATGDDDPTRTTGDGDPSGTTTGDGNATQAATGVSAPGGGGLAGGVPAAALLVAAVLVSASVLVGTRRIERALQRAAHASPGAPPGARRPPGRT